MQRDYPKKTGEILEKIYKKYHKKKFITPDPLEFLFNYEDLRDREIAALIAGGFALGRVEAIRKNVSYILTTLGPLYETLTLAEPKEIASRFKGFCYRFYKEKELLELLMGIRRVLLEFGSLNNCFLAGSKKKGLLGGLDFFVRKIYETNYDKGRKILPLPSKGSCCKRLFLFLRWMVRKDRIDPGGWRGISKAELIVPLDTHLFQLATILGLTKRRSGDFKAALEITGAFKYFSPRDPLKYDFSITRLGIHPDLSYDELKREL